MRLSLLVAFPVAFGLLAPGVATAGPGLVAGAVEDDVRASTLVEAEARMRALRLAGYRAVRVTSYWTPGSTRPTQTELTILENVGAAGVRNGVRVYVTVMHPGSRTTPLTDDARTEFASFAAPFIPAAASRKPLCEPATMFETCARKSVWVARALERIG